MADKQRTVVERKEAEFKEAREELTLERQLHHQKLCDTEIAFGIQAHNLEIKQAVLHRQMQDKVTHMDVETQGSTKTHQAMIGNVTQSGTDLQLEEINQMDHPSTRMPSMATCFNG